MEEKHNGKDQGVAGVSAQHTDEVADVDGEVLCNVTAVVKCGFQISLAKNGRMSFQKFQNQNK